MRAFGIDVMFTLNGGHIWPLYEACRNQGVRVFDTRHEQSATFAAEAYAKLTRRPAVAALTAGPGITNGVSAVTSAWFNGAPLVVLGGRAPQLRWGAGSLQELDHVPILASITKSAATVLDAEQGRHRSSTTPSPWPPSRTVGRCSSTSRSTCSARRPATSRPSTRRPGGASSPIPTSIARLAELVAGAERPVFVVGSDVYWAGAEEQLAQAVAAPAGPGVHQRARPRHPAGRPRAGVPAHPRPARSPGPTSSSCSARRSTSASASAASARPPSPTSSTPSRSAPPTSTC